MSQRAPHASAASPKEIAIRRAVMARDAGLARISAVTSWLAVGVVALSGALALIAASAFHGHTTASATNPAAAVQSSSASGGLAPAAVAPTQAAPVVVSGGS